MGIFRQIESDNNCNPSFGFSPISFLLKFCLTKSQSSMQIRYSPPVGLKTLIYSAETPFIFHSCSKISLSPFRTTPSPPQEESSAFVSLFRSLSTHSSSFSSWSSGLDDLLGTESGVYMSSDQGENMLDLIQVPNVTKSGDNGKRNNRSSASTTKPREYPPPIPSLVRTGNLSGHMPWVLTRHHENGRLTITEERVKRHEYFETRRENGRLILNLVTLDDMCCHTVSEEPELFEGEENDDVLTEFDSLLEENEETMSVDELVMNTHGVSFSLPKIWSAKENVVDPRQCFTYCDRMMRSLDGFGCEFAMSSPSSPMEFWIPRPTATLVV